VTEQAAREQARNTVRSQLNLRTDQFLGVHRDEALEEVLALAIGRRVGSEFIYRVSPIGDEIKEGAVVHHVSTDADLVYVIGISAADGSINRIRGFPDSLSEFDNLMAAARIKVSGSEQAEAVAGFYRGVNPENLSLTPISSLIELKQAAERQCQTSSFEAGEEAFDTWWKHARPLFAHVPFTQTATHHGSGYLVEWTVLSSAAPSGSCGGAPLRARLEVGSDGRISKLTFSPLKM
jgi:hypothetical protein